MITNTKLILGGPGSGKTHHLLTILEDEFSRGVSPERLAFVSFTRKAVQEAKDRVIHRFDIDPNELIYCRTLHSLTLRCSGLTADAVMKSRHKTEFGEYVSCRFSRNSDPDPFSGTDGDRGLMLDNYARATCRPLREVWEVLGDNIRWPWLKWFSDSLAEYKNKNFLVDYTDMLSRYLSEGQPLDIDVAIIDEAQDLSPLQWRVCEKAFSQAKRLYVAADDDQSIYKWSGADVQYLLDLKVNQTEILQKSHRLAPKVHMYSQNVVKQLRYRYPKPFAPADKHRGQVVYHRYVRGVPIEDDGSWLLLARNRMFLREFEEVVREHGMVYSIKGVSSVKKDDIQAIMDFERLRKGQSISGGKANTVLSKAGRSASLAKDSIIKFEDLGLPDRVWHDVLDGIPLSQRVYYVTALRRGIDIRTKPRILIDTIHGSKGGEADNVGLITDMTTRTWRGMLSDPDDETRCFYVGITRTRGNLHVVLPNTQKSFKL